MRYITLDNENKIISIRHGSTIIEGEIPCDIGELGDILQEDGTFIKPTPIEVEQQPTLEDKINYLYYKSIGVI